jgi:hypothetical protein
MLSSRRIGNAVLLLSTLTTFSCGRCSPVARLGESGVPVTKLLRRSATTSWEKKQLPVTGIEIEVPTDRCAFGDEPGLGAGVGLHTLPAPRGVFDDDRCLLQVDIQRMSGEQFQDEIATDRTGRKGDVHEKYRRWTSRRHDSIDRWDEGQYTVYRYDLQCPNGDMAALTQRDCNAIAQRLNDRPRKRLGFATPTEILAGLAGKPR